MYKFLLLIAALFAFKPGISQSKDEVYAGILLHVIKYVEWADVNPKVIKIGIVNNPKLVDALNKIVEKKNIRFKNVGVTKLTGVDSTGDLNVIFLAKKQANLCSRVNAVACKKKILVITEMKNRELVCPSINFFEENGKIKFELYVSVVDKCGLLISDQLKKFAILK